MFYVRAAVKILVPSSAESNPKCPALRQASREGSVSSFGFASFSSLQRHAPKDPECSWCLPPSSSLPPPTPPLPPPIPHPFAHDPLRSDLKAGGGGVSLHTKPVFMGQRANFLGRFKTASKAFVV